MSTPPLRAYGAVAAAGWYWDGAAWTQHIAAETAPTAPRGSSGSTGLVAAGQILAMVTPLIGPTLGKQQLLPSLVAVLRAGWAPVVPLLHPTAVSAAAGPSPA